MTMTRSSRIALAPPSQLAGTGGGASVAGLTKRESKPDFTRYECESKAKTGGFDDFVKANPACVAWIENRFLWYAAQGRHFSFALIWEEARYHACANNGRNLWRMPNDYRAPMLRYLCDKHPQAAKLTSRRRSR